MRFETSPRSPRDAASPGRDALDRRQAWLSAARAGHLEELKQLLDISAPEEATVYEAFEAACGEGKLETARWLNLVFALSWRKLSEMGFDPFYRSVIEDRARMATWLVSTFPVAETVWKTASKLSSELEQHGKRDALKWLAKEFGRFPVTPADLEAWAPPESHKFPLAASPPPSASRSLAKLVGPVVFVFFPGVGGKRVLLLGEEHKPVELRVAGAYEVHRWLADLARDAPECLDVMNEIPVLSWRGLPVWEGAKPKTGGSVVALEAYASPIHAINHAFENCRTSDPQKKRDCFSPQLRYHQLDDRFASGWGHWTEYLIRASAEIADTAFFDAHTKRRIIDNAIGSDLSSEASGDLEAYIGVLLGRSSRPGEDSLRFWNSYRALLPVHRRIIARAARKSQIPLEHLMQVLGDVYAYLVEGGIELYTVVLMAPMDVYALLRLFARYEAPKMSRGPARCVEVPVNKNVIIFSGVVHTAVYRLFLERYFSVKPVVFTSQGRDDESLAGEKPVIDLGRPFDFFGSATAF